MAVRKPVADSKMIVFDFRTEISQLVDFEHVWNVRPFGCPTKTISSVLSLHVHSRRATVGVGRLWQPFGLSMWHSVSQPFARFDNDTDSAYG
ncbi:beta-lactamase [Anopheles sinensis]|uniref:Beta-lactamase n=1 Tax=Anopheles sinensis TaxID=74873 RepID=A0A084W1D5_ANOSI|nr:beta-lactamase [Anopheles sinensis]